MPIWREGSIPSEPTITGGVAEWLIAHVLKTCGRDERPVGSNPASSALYGAVLVLIQIYEVRKHAVDWRKPL